MSVLTLLTYKLRRPHDSADSAYIYLKVQEG